MILKESGVLFDPVEHRYWLQGKELHGITSTLVQRAFPHTYDGVDEETLRKAAERGTAIHKAVEHYETDGEYSDCPELYNYAIIKGDHRLTWEESEYIVTDGERYASAIDLVMTDEDGGIVLGDIKTTYTPHYDNAALQLSIYRRFFEMQNPGMKVAKIAIVWLRGDKYEYRELVPWADEMLDALIEADKKDEMFDITTTYGDLPAVFAKVEAEVARCIDEEKAAKERKEKLTAGLLVLMEQKNIKKFTGSVVSLTRVLPTETTTFDAKAFAKDYPELYAQYVKKSKRAGSLRITKLNR